jgi:predicted nucleotidyltransferase
MNQTIQLGPVKFGEAELAQLCQNYRGRKVDLVSKKGLKPRIRASVLKEARRLYAA